MRRILSGEEMQAVMFALETAARKYEECAQEMKNAQRQANAADDSGYARMALQFERQRNEADRLCTLLGEYDGVTLWAEVPA